MNTSNTNLTLRLMREEIKSRKLATLLHQLGIEEQCQWLPSFNNSIAERLGLDTDEAFHQYDVTMDALARKVSNEKDLHNVLQSVSGFLDEIDSLAELRV
jgi:ribosomal protein L12E/L44/L45/RPP1/RPP2